MAAMNRSPKPITADPTWTTWRLREACGRARRAETVVWPLQKVSRHQTSVESRHRIDTEAEPAGRHMRGKEGAQGDARKGGQDERRQVADDRSRKRPGRREQRWDGKCQGRPGLRHDLRQRDTRQDGHRDQRDVGEGLGGPAVRGDDADNHRDRGRGDERPPPALEFGQERSRERSRHRDDCRLGEAQKDDRGGERRPDRARVGRPWTTWGLKLVAAKAGGERSSMGSNEPKPHRLSAEVAG